MSSSRELQINNFLTEKLQTSENFEGLSPQLKVVLNNSIQKSVSEISPTIITGIDLNSNKSIFDIKSNLVGASDPVDLVASNLSPFGLKQIVSDKIGSSLADEYSEQLSSSIYNDFLNSIPKNVADSIDRDALLSQIQSEVKANVTESVDQQIGLFSENTMSGNNILPPVIENYDEINITDSDFLSSAGKLFDNSASESARSESANFDTQNKANQDKLITQSYGFVDPTASYPSKEYQGKTDTNKLAQGDVSNTVVQQKEKERLKGIQLPNNDSWEQPKVPYNAEYPFNKVTFSESGHIIEIDDTPGSERLHVYHKSGTFIEIDSSGSVVKRAKGSSYEIIDKNGYVSVSGDASLSVKGSIKIFVGGNADIEVEGDTNLKCFNDITMQAAGRIDISATEEINLKSGNVNIESDINFNIKSDNTLNITSFYETNLFSNGKIYNQSLDEYNIISTNNINIDSTDGKYYVNSDLAAEAKVAKNANIGTIGDRKDVIFSEITDPVVPNFLDKYGLAAEDAEFEIEAINQQKSIKEFGVAKDEEFDALTIPIETITPSSPVTTIIKPDEFLLSQTYLPESFQLSKHFTLANLSTKAVVSNYKVQPQLGLTYGQIVYNLQGIALNVLEPLLALYPNMFVTSAFRSTAKSSTTSDHPRGKAVDIQFKNVSKKDYYEIANKLATNLIYDKLLLEYKTYGTGLPWIHISFDVDSPRKLVLTYLNDKKYSSGLTNLA